MSVSIMLTSSEAGSDRTQIYTQLAMTFIEGGMAVALLLH